MKYRQVKRQDKDLLATKAALKIRGKWIEGVLLDSNGNVLPLPHEVKKGQTYIIEASI